MFTEQFSAAKESAQRLLSENYIDNPASLALEHIAMLFGLLVRDGNLTGALATLITKEGQRGGIITVSRNISILGQRRFAIAHEIGHFRLHLKNKPAYICTEEMFFAWYKANSQEPEANAFAAELLMPNQNFRKLIAGRPPSQELLAETTSYFKTSLTATCARYAELGPYPCILFVSTDNKLKWVKASHDIDYYRIKIGDELTARSCAGDFFREGREEPGPQRIFHDAWFTDSRLDNSVEIFEYPIYLKKYNTVLSLVWFK